MEELYDWASGGGVGVDSFGQFYPSIVEAAALYPIYMYPYKHRSTDSGCNPKKERLEGKYKNTYGGMAPFVFYYLLVVFLCFLQLRGNLSVPVWNLKILYLGKV